MKIGNIVNGVINGVITIASAAIGSMVSAYCVNHDIMNDEDLSMIVGVTGGATTYVGTKAALTAVKDNTGVVISEAKKKLVSGKAKRRSVETEEEESGESK